MLSVLKRIVLAAGMLSAGSLFAEVGVGAKPIEGAEIVFDGS